MVDQLQINIEIWNVDKFDGGNTRRIRYDGAAYAGNSTGGSHGNDVNFLNCHFAFPKIESINSGPILFFLPKLFIISS